LYALRVVGAAAALLYFLPRYRVLDWNFNWRSVAIGVAVFLIWIAMASASTEPAAHSLAEAIQALPAGAAVAWIALRVIGGVVTVPVAEELAFRGFLLRRLTSTDFESVPYHAWRWLPMAGSSIVFGAMHGGQWLAGIVAGVLYAGAFVYRGRIGDAVIAHAVTNALVAASVLFGGRWDLW
jgi:CAAX prenyl protease-like protein